MTAFSLRPAEPQDSQFLTAMVVEAANWRPDASRPRVSVLADPSYAHFIAGWQRPGDRGIVAFDEKQAPVGAAWYRLFPANAPAHGFVSPGVPELIIGVNPIWRAQGIGRALLRALIDSARAEGHTRLSLSVEHGNYAEGLYRSEGFAVLDEGGPRTTMVRNLH